MSKILKYPLYYLLIFITFIYLIFVFFKYKIETESIKYFNPKKRDCVIKGKVLWINKNNEDINLIVDSNGTKSYLTINKHIIEQEIKIEINSYCVIKAELIPISFNNTFHHYLYNSFGVSYIGYVYDILSVEPNTNFVYKILNYLIFKSYYFREKIVKITKENLQSPYDSVILRLTLGYKDHQIDEIISYFQNAGVLHVLVVSGLHVGFVYIVVFFILKLLPIINRKIKILISLLSVIFYMFITECSAPVARATIIILCFGISELLNRKQSSFHSLILSFLVLLVINSNNIFNPSFQLSFLSFFGILYFYNIFHLYVKEYVGNLAFFIRYIIQLFLLTFSVQIMLIPFIIYYFNKISLVSFLSNIIVVPMTSLLLWLSIIVCFLKFIFSNIPDLFWAAVENLSFVYISIVKFFSKIPLNVINITRLSYINMIIYYFLILSIPLLLKRKKYKILISTVLFSVVSLLFNFNFLNRSFSITFLDVGLGDSILVSTCDKQNFLIDCGESKYVAIYNILPYLKKNKINEIQHLIITHPHYPHYGGLEYLVDNFKIRNVYINSLVSEEQNYRFLIEKIKNKNINLVVVDSIKNIKFHNGEINLIPNIVDYMYDKIEFFDINSLLIEVRYKSKTFILTNDIPFYYLKDRILKFKNSELILQIPRHGKYKEDFVFLKDIIDKEKKLKVKFAVVSTDGVKQNFKMLNFPVYDTLSYKNIKIKIGKDKNKSLYSLDYSLDGIVIKL
ncbi:MAG: DNA internalization-related competence protein ComEC/Rec2 [Endomicrobiia bacterium]